MKSLPDPLQFQQDVLRWYNQHGRKNLPWQQEISAYSVWLSEIMLQQTQVKTVIPYFTKFIAQFPYITALAHAPLDEILYLWSGLGYYSRARNLHRCAQLIVEKYEGKFPTDLKILASLPGIGRSTAAAILSLAYNQRAAILDGNVKRLFIRFHGIDTPITQKETLNKLWKLVEAYCPSENNRAYTQALMDLGAMICTRTQAKCHQCPLQINCSAHQTQRQTELPVKIAKKTLPQQTKYFLLLTHQKKLLLEQRPPLGIWGGLWSLPECEITQDIQRWCAQAYGLSIHNYEQLPEITHNFTHFRLTLIPILASVVAKTQQIMDNNNQVWYNSHELQTLGLPTPIKKILREIIHESNDTLSKTS